MGGPEQLPQQPETVRAPETPNPASPELQDTLKKMQETGVKYANNTNANFQKFVSSLGYAETVGTSERNTGLELGNAYAGVSHVENSGEPAAPFLGVAQETGNSGGSFTLEIDPRNPLAGQFLAYTRPLGESGNIRVGASIDLASGKTPTAYDVAIRGQVPLVGGEAGLAVYAQPPTDKQNPYLEATAGYRLNF